MGSMRPLLLGCTVTQPSSSGPEYHWGIRIDFGDWKQAGRVNHALPLGDLSTDRAEPHPAVPQAWEEQPLPTEPESRVLTPWAKGGQGEEAAAEYSNVISGKSTSHSGGRSYPLLSRQNGTPFESLTSIPRVQDTGRSLRLEGTDVTKVQ